MHPEADVTNTFKTRLCPHLLIDELLNRYGLGKDARLAEALDVHASIISKIRQRVLPVSAATMLMIHDRLGMPVKEIKQLVEKQKAIDAARDRMAAKRESEASEASHAA